MGVADPGEPLVATDTPVSWQPRIGLSYDQRRRQWEDAIVLAEDQDVQETSAEDDVDELLVEEISIDGMCGVY